MSATTPGRRPGDLIIDRYFKDADADARERVREALAELARFMEEFADAILERGSRDSRDGEECGTIPPPHSS